MRPTYSPRRPTPNMMQPIRKNSRMSRSHSALTPSSTPPVTARSTMTIAYSTTEPIATIMPATEKSCSGTSEKPVTRSKLSRISLYIEYFDSPAARSLQHVDFGRMMRERECERRNERAHLARGDDRVDDVAAVGAQHAALVRHPDSRDPLADAVHEPRRRAAPPRVLA